MKHLLNLREENGKTVVSARELYEFLEIKTEFSHWTKRMFEYGFVSGIDFTPFLTESTGGRPLTDYALTIDCAKEISMLQRTEKGKEARLYFIECEKRVLAKTLAPQSEDEIVGQALLIQQRKIQNLISEKEQAEYMLEQSNNTIMEQAPIVRYAKEVLDADGLIPITVIAKDMGMSAGALNKALNKRGVIYKAGETWVLYSKYQNMGYTKTKTHTYIDTIGNHRTAIHTFWTELGRRFIFEKMRASQSAA